LQTSFRVLFFISHFGEKEKTAAFPGIFRNAGPSIRSSVHFQEEKQDGKKAEKSLWKELYLIRRPVYY
jgi:hypothetical protein